MDKIIAFSGQIFTKITIVNLRGRFAISTRAPNGKDVCNLTFYKNGVIPVMHTCKLIRMIQVIKQICESLA